MNWLADKQPDATVFTTVDRAVYIEVTVPARQSYQPVPVLGTAIARVLPAVCLVPEPNASPPPDALLCTRRR